MPFTLQQVVIPVSVLGDQEYPATYDAWVSYFVGQIGLMRDTMPCQAQVRIADDIMTRMWGAGNEPVTEPSDSLPLLVTLGLDQHGIRIYLDRELAPNTVRLE